MTAEFMSFVHKNEVVFISIPIIIIILVQNLIQTSIGNKVCILIDTKVFECSFPVLFNGRRINYKNLGVFTSIFYQKLFGNHCSNDGLS